MLSFKYKTHICIIVIKGKMQQVPKSGKDTIVIQRKARLLPQGEIWEDFA